jgi:hypothetical protein
VNVDVSSIALGEVLEQTREGEIDHCLVLIDDVNQSLFNVNLGR